MKMSTDDPITTRFKMHCFEITQNPSELSPWQPKEEIEYEEDFVILTQTGLARSSAAQLGARAADTRAPPSDSDSRDELVPRSSHARTLKQTLYALDTSLKEQAQTLERLTSAVEALSAASRRSQAVGRVPSTSHNWDLFGGFVLAMVLQSLLNWIFYQKV